ncbi:MAG: single-stranded DNA-binding protein [Candidatus Harrisonbacteria bacterium CG10_big_fil_rev_8_21_14_0_10_49_15]|uniref:Single-stranded DNA-binding protein n=1 Tax=Candidatus Harrisonbacteria bacterium CG10_big_fil_rev_8_21_14_0_10_49_15 TaxID=1974587 RepID=A0A2H0ULU4_9BACT|nr:MAG: single-stranded DNA-binding protein [Candidatus Harrisonbacteria bacterium CG10_big_fil_rev_8_21_14_0_10_49_15]
MNLNKAFIIGRLTADPQLRSTKSGQSVAAFSLASNRVWNDKNNQKQEEVEYHNIVVWGKQAEIVSKFLLKGQMALIEGRIQTRSYEDKQGQKRYATEIVAERVQFGPKAAGSSSGGSGNSRPEANWQSASANDEKNDSSLEDIPTINIDEDIKEEDLPF